MLISFPFFEFWRFRCRELKLSIPGKDSGISTIWTKAGEQLLEYTAGLCHNNPPVRIISGSAVIPKQPLFMEGWICKK